MAKNKHNHLLILGEYATGKTTYGGQLYERLKARTGSLRLHSAPQNISPFSDPLRRLAQGTSPMHTPISAYDEVILSVSMPDGRIVELIWPDYGGEQITSIMRTQHIHENWLKRLSESNSWLLFIRLNNLTIYETFLTESIGVNSIAQVNEQKEEPNQSWSSVAALIELLQMSLYAKGVGTIERVVTPSLLIFLSCWDEMDEDDQAQIPARLLQTRLPLFYEFIATTWKPERFAIWGLSSTGVRLDSDQSNEAYLDDGPQQFGYVILPDGTHQKDLTLPLLKLME
ncbi:MAG TPA: hypothetical protein VFV38_10185 [Ktedonobacteraceae bacterium]|nr:hypothetical protein [Ktedonobacteraceae bacterium]